MLATIDDPELPLEYLMTVSNAGIDNFILKQLEHARNLERDCASSNRK